MGLLRIWLIRVFKWIKRFQVNFGYFYQTGFMWSATNLRCSLPFSRWGAKFVDNSDFKATHLHRPLFYSSHFLK